METNLEALERFIEAAEDWLTEEDAPTLAALRVMAEQLDNRFSAATMAQYGLFLRNLQKKSPNKEDGKDELEALLDDD